MGLTDWFIRRRRAVISEVHEAAENAQRAQDRSTEELAKITESQRRDLIKVKAQQKRVAQRTKEASETLQELLEATRYGKRG